MKTDVMVKLFDDLNTDILISSNMTPIEVPAEVDTRTPSEHLLQRLICNLLVPDQALEIPDEKIVTLVSELQYLHYLSGRILMAITSYNAIYDPSNLDDQFAGFSSEQALESERENS